MVSQIGVWKPVRPGQQRFMRLSDYVETLNLFCDESRLRLCALLRDRELCVTDLVQITGLAQSRVSTHLGRLRDAGFVRDRRTGAQAFYALAEQSLPNSARAMLEEALRSEDPTLEGDRQRLLELETERRQGGAQTFGDEIERFYSPGRSWQSLSAGLAGLLRLGDVLDVGCGDGAAASMIAPYCSSLTCVDVSARSVELSRGRLAGFSHVTVQAADAHELPFARATFDQVLLFHTLTYTERPAQALAECARVLRVGGRVVLLCLDRHTQQDVTAPYGERHAGFSPRSLRRLLSSSGLNVVSSDVACRESKKPHLQVVLAIAEKPES